MIDLRELDDFVYNLIEELEEALSDGAENTLETISDKIEALKEKYEDIKWGEDFNQADGYIY